MSIRLKCPHCGVAAEVADQSAGQVQPCERCGKTFTVPPMGTVVGRSKSGCYIAAILVGLILFCGVGGLLIALLLPAVQAARQAARRIECQNNLKQIALAMHNYHDAYKCFPPAFIADKNGKPMHSWRALLLPYLEQQPFLEKDKSDRYRFNEPWDSPNNRNFAKSNMVRFFQCPTQPRAAGDLTTDYMMVVGPHTISDGSHSRKVSDITDGTSNTIMIVEVADSGVLWTEPKDLAFDDIHFKINGTKGAEISSHHSNGVNVAFCDGSVHFLRNDTNPQLVKAMLTIDQGEQVTVPEN